MKENNKLTKEQFAYCLEQIGIILERNLGHISCRDMYSMTGVSDKTFTGMKKGGLDFHISSLFNVCTAAPLLPVSALNIPHNKIEQFRLPMTGQCAFQEGRHCLLLMQNPMFNQPAQ